MEKEMEAQDFWEDAKRTQEHMSVLKGLKAAVESYNELKGLYDDIDTLIAMGYEENDDTVIPEIKEYMSEFTVRLDNMRTATLLSGEYDRDNAILTLHSGAGGTESCDWANMLYRMYVRWAEKNDT